MELAEWIHLGHGDPGKVYSLVISAHAPERVGPIWAEVRPTYGFLKENLFLTFYPISHLRLHYPLILVNFPAYFGLPIGFKSPKVPEFGNFELPIGITLF